MPFGKSFPCIGNPPQGLHSSPCRHGARRPVAPPLDLKRLTSLPLGELSSATTETGLMPEATPQENASLF